METIADRPATLAPQAAAGTAPRTAGRSRGRAAGLPWPLTAAVLGATSIAVGLLWDISWHASIGRDTFWTPAHIAIYLGGLLCGLPAGWLALATTFAGTAEQRATSVNFWGFRAPLGAWVSIWGCIAMLTSAPFDDWWHNAYGLDVTIISPPHVLLAAGIFGCQLGAMLLALSVQNRGAAAANPAAAAQGPATATPGAGGRLLAFVYAYSAGLLLVIVSTLFLEYSEPNNQHGALFYEIGCAAYPLVLVAAARGARLRWPATTVAAIYMAVRMIVLWVLPLFPATPMLAPIYNPLRHMWPPFFPELLLAPAVAIDLIMRWFRHRHAGGAPTAVTAAATVDGQAAGGAGRRLALAFALGTAFTATFLAAHWYFSEFMLTPYARNWFFAADMWTYRSRLGAWRHEFWVRGQPFHAATIPLTLLLATVSARLGLAWGDWMSRVRR
jgi:hypothetical protein